MLSYRAAVTPRAIPTLLFPSVRRRLIGTSGNGSKHDQENSPNKQSQIPINHAPGWNEKFATASEAAVKADRENVTINEMRQKTVEFQAVRQRDAEAAPTHATYAREEIDGPLGSAGVGEFEGVVGKDDLGPDDAQVESTDGLVVTRRTTVIHKKSGAGQANV